MEYTVSIGDDSFEISIHESKEGLLIDLGKRQLTVDLVEVGPEVYSLLVNGRSHEVQIRGNGEQYQVFYGPRHYQVQVQGTGVRRLKSLVSKAQAHERPREIRAAMPGLVVKVEVQEGDSVKAGDGLVVVEAMKMENELRAHRPGVVKQVFVQEGVTVDRGQTLVIIE
jgi:biotin carboxyl carrier protein